MNNHTITPELARFIQHEIKRQMTIILYSESGENDEANEELEQIFPGMPKTEKRPVAHPYGFCSRAPTKTPQLNAKVGEHTTNRIVVSHLDRNRKELGLSQGESIVYNDFGQEVRLKDGIINIGKNADEPAVLGNVLVDFLTQLMDIIKAGDFLLTTTPGNPTVINPVKLVLLQQLITTFLTTASTNIISQEVFVERLKP